IESPATGAEFDRADDVRFSGTAAAGSGVRRFCLTASSSPPGAFPADCNERGQLTVFGKFTNLRVSPLVTGTNYITAWTEDQRLEQTHDTITVVLKSNDLRVANMEVTQAVQKVLPKPTPDDSDS